MENKKIKLAINGFGRIGRLLFKLALKDGGFDIVGINDLGDIDNLAYLLRYDSAQKDLNMKVSTEVISEEEKYMVVEVEENGKIIKDKFRVFSIRNPEELPWKDLEVDVVGECTGVFNVYDKAYAHIKAGAKKVVLSGPVKEEQDYKLEDGTLASTILVGINDEHAKTCTITSNASCTTNAAGNVLDIMDKAVGVESALLSTVHSYTASQSIVDGPVRKGKKDFRKGRAGAANIIPTSTGSAIATAKVLTNLKDKFDGIALRVPTISGSIADITFIAKKDTSVEEIKNAFIEAEKSGKYQGVFRTESDQVVSSDIIGDTHASIVDLNFIKVQGRLVKFLAWYDNEAGFTSAMLQHIKKIV